MYQEEDLRITHLEEDSIEGTIVLRVGLQVCGMYVPYLFTAMYTGAYFSDGGKGAPAFRKR